MNSQTIVLSHIKLKAKLSDRQYENDLVAVWTVRDGNVKDVVSNR